MLPIPPTRINPPAVGGAATKDPSSFLDRDGDDSACEATVALNFS